MQQFAAVLAAVPQKFAYALSALIEAGGAPGAPADAADGHRVAGSPRSRGRPTSPRPRLPPNPLRAGDAGAGEPTDAAGDDPTADDTSAGDGNEQES